MFYGRFKLPRARFWLPLAAVVLFALCVRFSLHYHVVGFFRGDAYYQGLPTSYWRDAAAYRIHGPPAWLRLVHRWLPRPGHNDLLPVYKGGMEAMPVLRQLAEDQHTDVEVRLSVLRTFLIESAFRTSDKWDINDPQPVPVPEVLEVARRCFDDPNADVRLTSASLLLYGDNPEPAFQCLFECHLRRIQDVSPFERVGGISGLATLSRHCEGDRKEDLRKRIRAMEADANRMVREHAESVRVLFDPTKALAR
jgi:hypothetical protein